MNPDLLVLLIPPVVLLCVALVGVLFARKRGGSRLDMAHYAAVFVLIFIVAMILFSIVSTRLN